MRMLVRELTDKWMQGHRRQPDTGDEMKTKAGSQLIQAILFMLAMVLGLLLLPGKDIHSETDCINRDSPESVRLTPGVRPERPHACSEGYSG